MLMLSRAAGVALLRARSASASVKPQLPASGPWQLNSTCGHARLVACRAGNDDDNAGQPAWAVLADQAPKPVVKNWNVRPITKDDVDFSFARSGGAGGQNVNKVNTKVDMRLDLAKATWIPLEIREQIRVAEKNRINNEGALVVASQKHRTQAQNMEDALDKLQSIIEDAIKALTPTIADEDTVKRVKANIKAGNERRLNNKKQDARKKQERSRKNWD